MRTANLKENDSQSDKTFPLGSKTQVIAIDGGERCAGHVLVEDAHASGLKPDDTLRKFLRGRCYTLLPNWSDQEAAAAFDRAEAESLSMLETIDYRRVISVLTKAHVLRRYAEESARLRRNLFGGSLYLSLRANVGKTLQVIAWDDWL